MFDNLLKINAFKKNLKLGTCRKEQLKVMLKKRSNTQKAGLGPRSFELLNEKQGEIMVSSS